MAVKLKSRSFLMPWDVMVGYWCFGCPCCLHLQCEVPEDEGSIRLPKHWYPTITPHGITTQKTLT